MNLRFVISILFLLCSTSFASPYSLSYHFGFQHFQQQAKSEIGGARGERLINQSEFSSDLQFYYAVNPYLQLGWYARYDIGNRDAGQFSHLDAEQKAVTTGELGGDFWELWTGPILKSQWKFLFAELGYGVIGLRQDDGRKDVPNAQGKTDSFFTTNSSIAWLLALGADAPLCDNLMLSVKLEYRVRYYSSRDGEDLLNNYEMGSQNITPMFGVKYLF